MAGCDHAMHAGSLLHADLQGAGCVEVRMVLPGHACRHTAALVACMQVLKRGGAFHCLEFSRLAVPGLRELYDTYSFNVIPRIGR